MMNRDKLKGLDPLRIVMSAELNGMQTAGLCALLCAAFFAVALHLCAGMEGAAVIAAVGTLCLAMLMLGACGAIHRCDRSVLVLLCAALAAMLAIGTHLAMLPIKPGRYTKVLEPLLEEMWNYELPTAMAWEDDGWSGGYLILCALLSRLENFSALYAIKLVDLVFLSAAACAALRLARQAGASPARALGAMALCMLAPTMLFNAGCWAQCDAIFAAMTLWGLALTLDDHPLAGCLLLGAALATKLQSAFVFPILLVLFMERRVSLRHLLAILLAFVALQAAILVDGLGLASLFGRYAQQLDIASQSIGLTDNAPGVFGLMRIASVREFSGMGLYLGIASALLVVAAMLRARAPLSNRTLLLGAWLLAAGLPLILPQMNVRCLYLACLLGFALARGARQLAVAAALEGISLCGYMTAIFGYESLPLFALSLLAIAAAVVIALELLAALKAPQAEDAEAGAGVRA